MKLVSAIRNLTARAARKRRKAKEDAIYDQVRAQADLTRLQAMQASYENGEVPCTKLKYFDFEGYVRAEIRRAIDIGLDRAQGLKLLDLGTGHGYFPFVCRCLGHEALGVDRENTPDDAPEQQRIGQLYTEMIDLLQVRRINCTVQQFVPLPDFPGGPFDVVTAKCVTFNRHNQPDLWDTPQWQFFLDDLSRQVVPGAIAWSGLNREAASGEYLTATLRQMFVDRGAEIDEPFIRLRLSPAARTSAGTDSAPGDAQASLTTVRP